MKIAPNNYDGTPFGPFTPYLQEAPVAQMIIRQIKRPDLGYSLPNNKDIVSLITTGVPKNECRIIGLQPATTHNSELDQPVKLVKGMKKARQDLKAALNIDIKEKLSTGIRDAVMVTLNSETRVSGIRKIWNKIARCYSNVALSPNLSITASLAIFLEGFELAEYVIECLSTTAVVTRECRVSLILIRSLPISTYNYLFLIKILNSASYQHFNCLAYEFFSLLSFVRA